MTIPVLLLDSSRIGNQSFLPHYSVSRGHLLSGFVLLQQILAEGRTGVRTPLDHFSFSIPISSMKLISGRWGGWAGATLRFRRLSFATLPIRSPHFPSLFLSNP